MNNLFHQHPSKWISEVYINVLDLTGMMTFYHQILGFELLLHGEHYAVLGFANKPMITLIHSKDIQPETERTQGLYHVAYLLPNKIDFSKVLRYLSTLDYPLEGLADHGVSMAVYLRDPEGNGIEIYVDREPTAWPFNQGRLGMVTDPLDVNALFSLSNESKKLPKETILGHLHLHVGNIELSSKYYVDKLGYKIMQQYGPHAMFLSDANYHHHLGINVWNGKNIPKKKPQNQGLVGYRVENVALTDEEDPSGLIVNSKKYRMYKNN